MMAGKDFFFLIYSKDRDNAKYLFFFIVSIWLYLIGKSQSIRGKKTSIFCAKIFFSFHSCMVCVSVMIFSIARIYIPHTVCSTQNLQRNRRLITKGPLGNWFRNACVWGDFYSRPLFFNIQKSDVSNQSF